MGDKNEWNQFREEVDDVNDRQESPEKSSIALASWRDKNKCLITLTHGTSNKWRNSSVQAWLGVSVSLLSLLTSIYIDYLQEYGWPPHSWITREFHPSIDENFPIFAKWSPSLKLTLLLLLYHLLGSWTWDRVTCSWERGMEETGWNLKWVSNWLFPPSPSFDNELSTGLTLLRVSWTPK